MAVTIVRVILYTLINIMFQIAHVQDDNIRNIALSLHMSVIHTQFVSLGHNCSHN